LNLLVTFNQVIFAIVVLCFIIVQRLLFRSALELRRSQRGSSNAELGWTWVSAAITVVVLFFVFRALI
jgi:heme/copper-type cytochrome/quinol oxidase subunit 2